MKRSVSVLAAVVALAGCANLEPDVAASVDDAELTEDELYERLGADADDQIDAAAARAEIGAWIDEQLLPAEGEPVDAFAELIEPGPIESDLICPSVLGPVDPATADEIIATLERDGDWSAAVDTVSEIAAPPQQPGGYIGCLPTSIGLQGFEDQIADLSAESPYTTIEPEADQVLIMRLTPLEEIPTDEQRAIAAAAAFGDTYQRGPSESGVICPAHILVDSEAAADEVVDLLDDGASFAEVAAERSTDARSGAVGGSLGCLGVDEFSNNFIEVFVEHALEAEVGEPTEPVESEFGFHVIRLRSFDQISPVELAPLINPAAAAADGADIDVSPTYGYYDLRQGVLPLG